MRQFNFKGQNLAGALKRTFQQRKTAVSVIKPLFAEEIYDERSDRQALWKSFLTRSGIRGAPDKLAVVAVEIEDFLAGPLIAIGRDEEFNKAWIPPGPWR